MAETTESSDSSAYSLVIRPRGSNLQYAWDGELAEYNDPMWQGGYDLSNVASTIDYFINVRHAAQVRHGIPILACLRRMLREDFRYSMMTSTRAEYSPLPRTRDRVIHNIGSPRESCLEINLIGPSGSLSSLPDARELSQAYFGTNDVRDVIAVFEAVSGRAPAINRLEERPMSYEYRPSTHIMLGINHNFHNRFTISHAYKDSNDRRARRVIVTPTNL